MKNFQDKVVVITGGGSGLGRALTLQFAKAGARLALCDIDQPGMEETRRLSGISDQECTLHIVDVSDRAQMIAFASAALNHHAQIDILINNAGITISPMSFDEISNEEFERVININMWGVYNGIRAFLPHLRAQPEAAIVNVSSLAGQVGLTGYAPYAMSKFAVRGLSETLQAELSTSRISVLAVYPGGIKTNIIRNAPNLNADQRESAHQAFTQTALLDAEDAAKEIINAVKQKRNELILGMDARMVMTIRALFPRRFPSVLHTIFSKAMFK